MKLYITIIFTAGSLFLLNGNSLFCQMQPDSISNTSQNDPRIDILVKRYNKTHELHGYRIQIISSSRKDQAKRAKSKFASKNQSVQAHEIYEQPFFIIKVGDFLTKIEAEKFHREIVHDFPGSFVLPDVIDPYKQYSKENSN